MNDEVTPVAEEQQPPAPALEASEVPSDTGTETEAPEAEAPAPAGTDEGDAKDRPKGFERRVAKLTQKHREAEQEVAYWKKAALEAGIKSPQSVPDEPSDKKPTFDEYNDIEAYGSAIAEWTAARAVRKALKERDTERQGVEIHTTYQQKVAEFKKTAPDFDEVFEELEDIKLAPELVSGVMESDHGPALAYHLAKNLDVVEKLNALPPHKRLIELGKLEERLQTKKVAASEPRKVSQAPANINSPKASTTAVKPLEEMSMEEFVKHRNKTDRRR